VSTAQLAGVVTVVFSAVTLCLTPVVTRPTVPFGVRVPGERTSSPVIRRERRTYFWRTAAVGACGTIAALLLHAHGAWWLSRVILLLVIAADLGCYRLARQQITAVKTAEHWYAGYRQIVATDTSWRTDPPRFPVRWLIPALAVIAVTVVVGALRYPDLPARLALTGWDRRQVPKSIVTVFAVVAAQLYVTALWTGLMLLVYRARPDIEATDPAASTRRYRRFLTALTRAVLTLLALVDLTLLLAALPKWQVYRLSGPAAALPVLPFAVGLLVLAVVGFRVGQGGSRLPQAAPLAPAAQEATARRPGPTGTTTGSGRRGWSTSTATTPPSWSPGASASAGPSTSGTGPRGWSSPPSWPPPPAWPRSPSPRACKPSNAGPSSTTSRRDKPTQLVRNRHNGALIRL
jgi:uncharacterized membrane protein